MNLNKKIDMKKVGVGGRVYFENKKGKIDSFICNKITEDECGFILHSKGGRKRIYFEQALEETDPKVIEYKQQNKNKE